MRGDSLRDLYAKTLALFGLALLAGVGALVDYWPSGAIPAVQSPAPMAPRGLPTLTALQADARAAVSSPPQVSKTAAQAVAPRHARPKIDRSANSLESLPVTVATAPADAELVSLAEPPLPMVVPVVATRVPAPEVSLPAAPDFAPSFGPDPPDAPLVDTSPDGFFGNATTAFRKTGESIVSTTVKTGTSIIKAFGFVGGAFKKVI